MSANPHANGGLLLRDLRSARLHETTRWRSPSPATSDAEATRVLGVPARRDQANAANATSGYSARTRPPPTGWAPCSRPPTARGTAEITPRRRPPVARRPGHGDPLRAPVPGLAGRLPAHRPARAVQLLRGLHPHHRLDVQPAREMAEGQRGTSPGAGRSPRSTTCSPRMSGGRTTTASATRTPASSTTW